KTAVDVQMTSAVRTVSPAAVHNGPLVSALLADLARRTTGLAILEETAAGAVLVDGEPCRSLAVVMRRAPRRAAGEGVLPLAWPATVSPHRPCAGTWSATTRRRCGRSSPRRHCPLWPVSWWRS